MNKYRMKSIYRNITVRFIVLALLSTFSSCNSDESQRDWDDSQGYVPDSTTAIKIAEIVFVRIYGDKVLKRKPFNATLKDGRIWVVDGSLEKVMDGGVPHMEIQKADGKIITLYHSK